MKLFTILNRFSTFKISLLLCATVATAQVGVNTTTPNASAALDIRSTNKGFLMTKVALTGTNDNTTISGSPTTGLLVYNTATAGSVGNEVTPGFYYFDGSIWKRFYTQGYNLTYEQSAEVLASTTSTEYVILPGLDTGEFTVPFSGTYQIRVEAFYSAGNLISTTGDGATQGSISLAMADISTGGGGGGSGDDCTGGVTTYPYNESFESGLGLWTQSAADFFDWTRDAGGTPSGNTGPAAASNGSWYIYTEASTPNYPDRQTILTSPCFNLTSLPAATFTFDYHMYGAADMGTFLLEVSDDDGGTWTPIWSQTGNQGNVWNTQSVDLSAYIGGSIQLRFNRTTGSTWQADIAIDNISLTNTAVTSFTTLKETYLTSSSKRLGSTTVNNLAQSASIIYNINLAAGTTYRFAVRGREWLPNNVGTATFGKNTSGYSGSSSVNDAQRGTMTISLIRQF
ncbi:choice-of-anchor J domain-containing protein [Altibacter sp. HG106]|uniref:choice-of-anchor J domain-containing protein n=1 Tax=Altibacter sp. HG106 TaxID=3023937 RepID=UPI002350D5A2|nr:choice-of-anchor J domain-containing protein [Altibacter sp. HG106]MDC7995896.1 choice-of-anchor J domain-containing protein [Altibacter sp. HG106]